MAYDIRKKQFVRVDAKGKIVPFSNIIRNKKPAIGNWLELSLFPCCEGGQYIVVEDRDRRQQADWTFDGTIRTVGPNGTYSTITAAVTAAASGDILQLEDGIFDLDNESAGYLFFNAVSKNLLIRGNASDRSAVVLTQSNMSALFLIRITGGNYQFRFQDLTITSARSGPCIRTQTPTAAMGLSFVNCVIDNTSATISNETCVLQVSAHANYYEFIDCEVHSNDADESAPILMDPVTNVQQAAGDHVLFLSNSILHGKLNCGDTSAEVTMYDTRIIEQFVDAPLLFSFSTDGGNPSNTTGKVDVRSCTIKYENGFSGHAVLLGVGAKDVYFVNNTIEIPSVANSAAIGMVMKCVAENLNDIMIGGNNVTAPRPWYIKGGRKMRIIKNQGTCNWPGATYGYCFEIQNPNNGVTLYESIENVVTNNRFTGTRAAFRFTSEAGAQLGSDSAKLNTFNNNIYIVGEDSYIESDGDPAEITWEDRASFWSQDVNSTYRVG